MLFNSHIFIFIFLPITLTVFYWIGGKGHNRIAVSWLVGSSFFFYSWWNPIYLGLILFSILFNYGMGVNLSFQKHKTVHAKMLLLLGLVVNLGLLGYFKYANFFVDSVNFFFDPDWHIEKIILPIAISFFTFQQIAYLMDAYQGLTHEYNFLHYCLFVTFFPQLIAGPIVHHREMLPQFARAQMYSLQVTNISIGLTIFTIGLFKKVVIADRVAFYATPVFASAELGQDITFFSAWTGAVAYTLQLYFDFSGYSDMAIGLARMFGITLPLNFNSPYQAINIVDFWDRWHMTLSRFLRDYLYIPLGGNRHGSWRRHTNIMITMLLGGLWHGAGWTFIAWGGLHGFYLIANNLWHNLWRRPINRWWSRTIARFITLLTIMIAWVFFRAETFGGALHILAAMANLPNTLGDYIGPLKPIFGMVGIGFSGGYLAMEHYKALLWATFWLTVLWFWPNTQQLMAGFRPTLDKNDVYGPKTLFAWVGRIQWQPSGWWGVVLGVMAAVTFLSLSQISEFLYFQF